MARGERLGAASISPEYVLAGRREKKAPEKLNESSGGSNMLASRRHVLTGTASLAITAASGPAFAAIGPDDKFDLVIKGGEVLDPSQSLRGRRDIGIRYGVIEAVEADIP